MNKTTTTLLFALAIFTAASAPFVISSYSVPNTYGAPRIVELTRTEKQFVNEKVFEYCQAQVVKQALPTTPTDPSAKSIPVILYHRITEKDAPSHEVTRPNLFRSHLMWLKQEGYTTVTVAQLTDYMKGAAQAPLPEKPIVITFDDGWKDNIEAAKTLEEFGFGATFYVVSGFFGNKLYFSRDELIALSKNPKFEIGSHTHSHFVKWEATLQQLDLCTMASEAVASKRIIEQIIKKPVKSVAWPYGYNTPEAVYVAEQIGYTSTMMVNADTFNQPGHSPLFTRRLNVDGTCPLSDFKQMIKTQKLKECS